MPCIFRLLLGTRRPAFAEGVIRADALIGVSTIANPGIVSWFVFTIFAGAPEIQPQSLGHPSLWRAEGSNRSGSFTWAGKQEKLRSMQLCFFLTSPLIELIRNWRFGCAITTDLQNKCLNEVFDPATQRTLANFQPVPELRHRGGEFKRNITARRLRRNGYDDALLRLIVSLVRYHYSLAGLDTTSHQDQSASSIDGDCKGLLVKRIAT